MPANLIRVPETANKVYVTGIPLPGVAKLTGAIKANKLDVQNGSGTSGATVVYKGSEPKAFKVILQLLTEDEFDEWIDGAARKIILTPPTGKQANAYDVYHPSLDECGITSAITVSVTAAIPDGLGGYTVEIEMMPYVPPKPSHGTPKGSKGSDWQKAPPQDQYDRTLDDLNKQLQDL